MKLFTKDIDRHLFKQYHLGSDLENQVVVAKIFNPYGRGRWFLINSDPDDSDYIWAIVQMGDIVEVGSVSRSELETIRVSPFRLPLERDLGFSPVNAEELLNGLRQGKFYKKGGFVDNENKEMVENQATEVKHHSEELSNALKNTDHVDAWVVGKMERATTDLSDVTHYLDGESKKMADGGSVDKLVGKHIDIYTEGVKEPMTEKIISSRVTPSQYTHRNLILEIQGGGEERIPLSKLDDFLNHKEIYLKDSKGEDYAISLNKKYADGGMMAKRGMSEKPIPAIMDDYGNIKSEKKLQQDLKYLKEAYENKLITKDEYDKEYNEIKEQIKLLQTKENGGMMAKGGMVVTSIKDIPNFKQRLEEGKITYRGLGMGKVYNDFYNMAGESGTRIKVDGKEYFITDTEFDTFSRDSDGKMRIRFDAPQRKGYADGGETSGMETINYFEVVSGLRASYLSEWAEKNNVDLVKVAKAVKTEKLNPIDLSTAVSGKDGNKYAKEIITKYSKNKMSDGGMSNKKTTFDDKVKAIQSSLLKRKKVSPKVQNDYGKTYDKKEALQSAKRIVGAMRKKGK